MRMTTRWVQVRRRWGDRSTWALLAALAGTGCARQAVVAADGLPMARVVIYRNGVAYFERAGHVDRDQVRFKMRPSEVGDFLATLAVMERGGSSVRAAAFPLNPGPVDDDGPKPPAGAAPEDPNGLKTVVLSLDGAAHDLQVGYVAESPVWRPSYRLVIRADGEADLQAWGIVENLSGEDWKDVKLSLVAGAPLAFQAELGIPVTPPRPTVTDEGEVIAAVPRSETSLRQDEAAKPAATPSAPPKEVVSESDAEPEAPASMGNFAKRYAKASGAGFNRPSARTRSAPQPAEVAPPPPPAPAPTLVSPPRSLQSLAAVAAFGGATRYDLPTPVTVPDKSATMVMLLSRRVSGEALFLFAPDGGVPDSESHPFRVARFVNTTHGTLERGPIAVFEEGSFLGQGMVDPLPDGATTTVPFALERAIALEQERKIDEVGARIAKIENSELTIERDEVTQTTYRIRNGGEDAAKMLVKHRRIAGSRLFAPPAGTEDNVGTGTALVPAKVPAHATAEIVVDERTTVYKNTSWLSPVADQAVQAYLADAKSDPTVAKKLAAGWTFRNQIADATAERRKLEQESRTLARASEETRRNLGAIEKNKTAEALRQKLTARLAETASRLDDVNRREVEIDAKLAELGVQFNEVIRDLKVL